ncbi:MAG: bifunctional (p)ppGpp synthetase/guanosine-3',5'-bis(diphosphate) 3'-pyrophosphohydrolase [Actinobacteria bacterium]|nr:bifunctional (p)ppGpp synthetase/guanosine-3',5'-bis(diphosphate) 3'-pyrophosphohydrolase [Actinomycetota bacterium]
MARPTDTHKDDARRLNRQRQAREPEGASQRGDDHEVAGPPQASPRGVIHSHGRVGIASYPPPVRPVAPAKDAEGEAPRGVLSPDAPPPNHAATLKPVPEASNVSQETRAKFAELLAVITEHANDTIAPIDIDRVRAAFEFAAGCHGKQLRRTGEDFVVHPVEVAKICVGMRLDTETLCAALLHDTVEDTSTTLEDIHAFFGDETAVLVDGVTKLTGITFKSRDEAQAENYRKMIVAMAQDIRVILIKLADRLHNMRTIGAMPKQKQIEKSRETLDIFAPLAHRLGIHAIKWELEDLAFATLHPRKFTEIKALVSQQREEREQYVNEAGAYLAQELAVAGITAMITGRAKHFYSIYVKMTKKGREFNEIFDLTAMRVIVDSVKDCYGAVGIVHSIWKPLPGRFKDFIAMPKTNMYQALHTTVIGPEGRPLEIQIRTREMHDIAEYGVAAHWSYKQRGYDGTPRAESYSTESMDWVQRLAGDPAAEDGGSEEFVKNLKVDLFDEEVFVFTPQGEVKNLSMGATPLDFAYEVHTDVGHRCVGAKVNGKIVPLHYKLNSGDIVEILTSKHDRAPSRDWLALVKTTRARNKIRAFLKREQREGSEHRGRDLLQEGLRKKGLPSQKITGSEMLAEVMREIGFRKVDEFYIAIGQGKIRAEMVVEKVMNRLAAGESAVAEETLPEKRDTVRQRPVVSSGKFGITVDGAGDVMVRLAKCCLPVAGDHIVGYVSLGRGITVHRKDCPNAVQLAKNPERFVKVDWEGSNVASFRAELEVSAWDRPRLLEDLSRAFSEAGVSIIEARVFTQPPMARNRFVIEVADAAALKSCINRVRQVESVFDAYRVTPGG